MTSPWQQHAPPVGVEQRDGAMSVDASVDGRTSSLHAARRAIAKSWHIVTRKPCMFERFARIVPTCLRVARHEGGAIA